MSGILPKKPSLPAPDDPSFLKQVKTLLEILCGRRGNKIVTLYPNKLTAAGATPTQAEYNALGAQVETMQEKVNELIARLDT